MKKVLSLFVLCILLFAFGFHGNSVDAREQFNDLGSTKWAEEAIYYLNDMGVIKGYGNGKFGPSDKITREQAALMLVRQLYPNETSNTKLSFRDVKSNSYYYNAIAVAVDHGLFEGFPDGTFKPQDPITRAATSKIIALAYNLSGTNAYFNDINKAPWAVAYIKALASNRIVNGYEDGTFKPNNTITRAEFSLSFARVLNEKFKPDKELFAHFIDVGQGDSIFIQTPNGKNILVDGGKKDAGDEVVNYLNNLGVKSLDLVVATHPDADHIGGLINVLNTFPVSQVLDSGKEHTSQTYLEYLQVIDSKNIPFSVAVTGQNLNLDGDITITVLNSGDGTTDNNEASVALKFTYGNMDILLTGDAEAEQEQAMLERFNVEAEIYKAAHHGSNTGNSLNFLNEVSPDATVLSYGKDNSYGHPHQEVVQRLQQVGSKIYSTADSGNIVFTVTKSSFKVSTTPWATPPQQNALVTITGVNEDNETVSVKNNGTNNVDMTGWKLVSVEGNQTYEFPAGYMLNAGATVTVTSGPNAVHSPPSKLKWTTANIWLNSGDPAQLFNSKGEKVSELR